MEVFKLHNYAIIEKYVCRGLYTELLYASYHLPYHHTHGFSPWRLLLAILTQTLGNRNQLLLPSKLW